MEHLRGGMGFYKCIRIAFRYILPLWNPHTCVHNAFANDASCRRQTKIYMFEYPYVYLCKYINLGEIAFYVTSLVLPINTLSNKIRHKNMCILSKTRVLLLIISLRE